MRVNGSQAMNSSLPTMPPRISTVRVVPTPCGSGLVQVTLVITGAQRGQDPASPKTSNSCSGVMAKSTLLRNRNGAISKKLGSTRSQSNMANNLTGAVAGRGQQRHHDVADRCRQVVGAGLADDHPVAGVPLQPAGILPVR